MGNVHRMSMLMHDESIRPDGTGGRTYYQPEGVVDYGPGSESGVTFQLDVHGIVGTADSWYLTTKFQLGMGDIAGSGWAQQRWRDLQPEQIAKLICEGVDWYGGIAAPFSLTNLCTNPSLETASTGWSAVSGTGGTAAGARLTTAGYSGGASYRITWSVATTSSGTGGISSQSGAVTAGAVYSGGMRVRPSKDQWIRANLEFRDAGNAVLSTKQGTAVFCPANVWTRATVENKTAPALSTKVLVTGIAGNGSTAWAASDTLDGDAVMINTGATANSYFDGDSENGTWTGTAHASTSTLLVTPTTAEVNTVARSTDTLPVTVSRTIKNFGRLVRVYIVPVAVNPSSDFAVTMSLTSSY